MTYTDFDGDPLSVPAAADWHAILVGGCTIHPTDFSPDLGKIILPNRKAIQRVSTLH